MIGSRVRLSFAKKCPRKSVGDLESIDEIRQLPEINPAPIPRGPRNIARQQHLERQVVQRAIGNDHQSSRTDEMFFDWLDAKDERLNRPATDAVLHQTCAGIQDTLQLGRRGKEVSVAHSEEPGIESSQSIFESIDFPIFVEYRLPHRGG